MNSYICPFCKEKQTKAVHWEETWVAYEYNLETEESEEIDKEAINNDNNYWACPSCNKEFTGKTGKEIEKMLGW